MNGCQARPWLVRRLTACHLVEIGHKWFAMSPFHFTARVRARRAILLIALAFAWWPRPSLAAESHPGPSNSPGIGSQVFELTRSVKWRKIGQVKLDFRTYHPQGMTIVGDRFYLSSVEVLDRAGGQGVGHLFEVDFSGRLRRQIRLGTAPVYHPGGIDFDGRSLWVPVAEYRPDSRSVVYRVDPVTLDAVPVFTFEDHLGALVYDRQNRQLIGVSWGSRRFYRWQLVPDEEAPHDAAAPVCTLNSSHYVDYQDGQSLEGTSWALFGGVSRLNAADGSGYALGGLELVDLRELRAIHQVPVPLWTAGGQSILQNPFAARIEPEGLRLYFLPEDDDSWLYRYAIE